MKDGYKNLIQAIFNPKEKSPNLGARRLILSEWKKGKKKFAIWHKDTKKWIDKNGKEYEEKELY